MNNTFRPITPEGAQQNVVQVYRQLQAAAEYHQGNPEQNIFSGVGHILGGGENTRHMSLRDVRARFFTATSNDAQGATQSSTPLTTSSTGGVSERSGQIVQTLDQDINRASNGEFFNGVNVISVQRTPVEEASNLSDVLSDAIMHSRPLENRVLSLEGQGRMAELERLIRETMPDHLRQIGSPPLRNFQDSVLSHMDRMASVVEAVARNSSSQDPILHSASNHFSGIQIVLRLFSREVLEFLQNLILDSSVESIIIIVGFFVKFAGLFISACSLGYFIGGNTLRGILSDVRSGLRYILTRSSTILSETSQELLDIRNSARLITQNNSDAFIAENARIHSTASTANSTRTWGGWASHYLGQAALIGGAVGVSFFVAGFAYYLGPTVVLRLTSITTAGFRAGAAVAGSILRLIPLPAQQRAAAAAAAASIAFANTIARLSSHIDAIAQMQWENYL